MSIRKLALATAVACVAAQTLSHTTGASDGHNAPVALVLGQAVWNAAQVGLLLLLLCMSRVDRRWLLIGIAALGCLPFAIYAISPGAWVLAALLLATCVIAWLRDPPDLEVAVIDALSGTPTIAKFEFLAFIANLFCSMYNFMASKGMFPWWATIFNDVGNLIGFNPGIHTLSRAMFTLGLDVPMPGFIKMGSTTSSLGALVFLLIWTVLPFIYVLYFAALAKIAEHSPGTRAQQIICALCIFHFLFLTDVVDYRVGRGLTNAAADWAHWNEVFAWRVAVLLPIYQKFVTGQWLRGNGHLGVLVHYCVGLWALGFFAYEVMLYNVPRFIQFALGAKDLPAKLFGHGYSEILGYHGALVLMTLLYAFMLFGMRCKRISMQPKASTTR